MGDRLRGLAPWLVAWAILSVTYAVGTIGPSFDLKADRLVALAALDGLNPYVPLDQLADRYDSTLAWDHVHPRTPGALVLQLPLALVPEPAVRVIAVTGTAAAVVATVAIALRLRPLRWPLAVSIAVVVGATSVAVEAVTVGAQSPVVALLLAIGWWRLRERDDVVGGAAVAVAVTLKLFPWLLVIVLLARRRRAAQAAAIAGLALNGIGLAFPGVSFGAAWNALTSAADYGSSEISASLAGAASTWVPFGVTSAVLGLMGVGFALWALRNREFDAAWFGVLAIGLACAPLVWRHYSLVLVPALVWLATDRGRLGRTVAVAATVIAFLPWPLQSTWLIVPVALAVAIASVTRSERSAVADPAVSSR